MVHTIDYEVLVDEFDCSLDGKFMSCLVNADIDLEVIRNSYTSEVERYVFWKKIGYKYIAVFRLLPEQYMKQKKDAMSIFAFEEIFKLLDEKVPNSIFSEELCALRNRIRQEITDGIHVFEKKDLDILNLEKYALAVLKYFKGGCSKKELIEFQELPVIRSVHGKNLIYPLTVDGLYTMGIVNPWPGDKSAEAEVLTRMKVGAADIGLDYVMLDNFGHILEQDTQKATTKYVDSNDLQFVITTHYDSEKTIDAYYYHTLWNPPEIPLNLHDYDTRVTNNYLMNDDYLIYDFGGMSNHLRGILMNKPRTIEGASSLTASFPMSKMLEPKLENPILFYCGMNWEKVVSNSNRHEGLFKLLDETGKVKFYGPEKVDAWGGLRPWEGYKCYQYSIPFDGFSILDEINSCGICLVLSSDIHRRAGAATNRTYEACAAGAVIISDDNEFMLHYFKDAALFIEYNKNNPKDTFNQIMEKYQWIVQHKKEALEMAKKAQRIFIDNFSVDNQMLKIVNNHYNRFHVIEKDLFAKNENEKVLVTYIVNTLELDEAKDNCNKVISNIINQYYSNIELGIACDYTIAKDLYIYIKEKYYNTQLIAMELFDHKKSRKYTDGQAIRILQNSINHDYWINMFSHEIWYYDHITSLVRTIQDEDSMCAFSARNHKDKLGHSRCDYFNIMHISTVYGMSWPDWLPVPGQILFKYECEGYLPDFMMECLDGYEHYAYLGIIWIKHKLKIGFSKRMTLCWCASDMDVRNTVLNAEFQIRYLRDIMRFDLPEGGMGELDKNSLRNYMLEMPIKSWIKARWLNNRMKYHTKSKKKKERLKKKYDRAYDIFTSI